MKNQEVAALLYEIADLMEIKGEIAFKVIAYRRAAQTVETMSKDVEAVWQEGKLEDLQGVGKGIAETIAGFLEKGKSKHLDELKKGFPPGLVDMLELEGIGPKKVKLFYEKLKIKSIKDLEKACKSGKLRNVPGLGEKTEQNILQSIEHAKKRGGRMLLGYAVPIAEQIVAEMRESGHAERVNVAGSIRRGKETIGDIDILVTSEKPDKAIEFFTKMKDVADVIAKGPTKASVHLHSGLQVDLRVLTDKEYGSALMYFTGSKEHNVEMRRIAIAKRMKLSEYGLLKSDKFVAGHTEEEVYKQLGMQFVPPEIREMRGEIEAAQHGKLPKLIELRDIRGDLQMHTKWSDGSNTVEEMAQAASQLGYQYICITDHAGNMKIANAMGQKEIERQRAEIDKINKHSDIHILQGAEIDIRADGRLDVSNDVLKKLDIVLASLHSALKKDNTSRILAAMDNPNVDIIAHPSGRLIDRRETVALDMPKIIDKAKETCTILEIDAQPNRLDLNDVSVRAAVDAGCLIAIDTDAHAPDQLGFMKLGVLTARRGWTKKEDVINTRPLDKMLKCLK